MKLHSFIFCVGAIIGARLLPAHGIPVGISEKDVKGDLLRGVTLCNDIHGCGASYVESIGRKDLAPRIWQRADVGAEGEGAAAGEGSRAGDGAQGEGGRREGPQESPGYESPGYGSPSRPPSVPSEIVSLDGSLPDRSSADIGIDDDTADGSQDAEEVLTMQEYATKGQSIYDLMMQAVHKSPKQSTIYASFNERYRLRSEPRSPLALDPHAEDPEDDMAALLHIQPLADALKIDLDASDWTFRMLTAKGQPVPSGGIDLERDATIVTYGSKAQKIIIVTKSDSIDNDIPEPTNPNSQKVPNSDLTFQLLQQQAGDDVFDTQYIMQHAITQPGTASVLKNAHASKGLPPDVMATWTVADGDVFRSLLGTKNGRSGVYMLADHAPEMKCKVVTKIYTWAAIPDDPTKLGAMVEELGPLTAC